MLSQFLSRLHGVRTSDLTPEFSNLSQTRQHHVVPPPAVFRTQIANSNSVRSHFLWQHLQNSGSPCTKCASTVGSLNINFKWPAWFSFSARFRPRWKGNFVLKSVHLPRFPLHLTRFCAGVQKNAARSPPHTTPQVGPESKQIHIAL